MPTVPVTYKVCCFRAEADLHVRLALFFLLMRLFEMETNLGTLTF